MRNQQMPDQRLERLRVRGHRIRIHYRDNHARLRDFRRKTTVSANDPHDLSAHGLSVFQRSDTVYADPSFRVSASHREYKYSILPFQLAATEPVAIRGLPTIVVDSGRQFRNIVGGCVTLHSCNLAEVIHGMRRVPCAAAYSQEE